MKKILVFSLIFISYAYLLSAVGVKEEVEEGKAKEEIEEEITSDEVRVYTAHNIEEFEKLAALGERITGLKIKFVSLSVNEQWSRLEAEAPNFGADLTWNTMNMYAELAKAKGWLIPYKSPAWEDIPDKFKDAEGYWHGTHYMFSAIGVNLELLEKENLPVPKSWSDLSNPIYRGKIVMPDPLTSGTAFLTVSAIMQIYGEEKAWDLFKMLDKNVDQYTSSGTKPAQMVAQGEYPVCISWDGAIFSRFLQGYPIELIIPSEGVSYDLSAAFILKGCKNIGGAKKIIDLLGSEEYQKLLATEESKVTRPGVGGLVDVDAKLISYDSVWAGENRLRIINDWKEKISKR